LAARLLHRQHPQPKHARSLCRRRARFFRWLEARGVRELGAVRTHHISAYVEVLTRTYRAPTIKQHLAAIRMLFDWLIVGQVVGQNPAAAVRGPKGRGRAGAWHAPNHYRIIPPSRFVRPILGPRE
jgi:integrase/recombinase XerD